MNNKKRIILIFWGVAEYGGVPTMFKNIQNESLDNYEIKILQIKTIKQLDAFIGKYEYKNPCYYHISTFFFIQISCHRGNE